MARPMNFEDGAKLVKDLHEVLKPFPCFLSQGSALGAYRDGGFTPTELDVDISFLGEDMVQYGGRIACRLVEAGFEVHTVNKPFNAIRIIKAFKYGIKADLAAYLLWKDVRFCNSNLTEYSLVHPRKLLEEYMEIQWFGTRWNIPKDIEVYLKREYGDWQTPRHDHVSKSRVPKFRKTEGIPNGLLDKIAEKYYTRPS